MPHHLVLPKLILPIDEILPHQVLREREGRERDFLDHLKPGGVAHFAPHGLENERKIEAALVARQLALKLGDPKIEITLEELEQGEVEPYVVLVMCNSKRRLSRTTLELDVDRHDKFRIAVFR